MLHVDIHLDQMETCSFFSAKIMKKCASDEKAFANIMPSKFSSCCIKVVIYSKISVNHFDTSTIWSIEKNRLGPMTQVCQWVLLLLAYSFFEFFPCFCLLTGNFSHNVLNSMYECSNLCRISSLLLHSLMMISQAMPISFNNKKNRSIWCYVYCVTWIHSANNIL